MTLYVQNINLKHFEFMFRQTVLRMKILYLNKNLQMLLKGMLFMKFKQAVTSVHVTLISF